MTEEKIDHVWAASLAETQLTNEHLRGVHNLARAYLELGKLTIEMHAAIRSLFLFASPDGFLCDLCNESWPRGNEENHEDGCLAAPTPPSAKVTP